MKPHTLRHLLATLISHKTLSGDFEAIDEAFSWIRRELEDLPVFFKEHEYNGHRSLVITTKKGEREPSVLLAAHIDVVPGSDTQFRPEIKDGKMYGRGVYDMKFAIACFIKLFQELGNELSHYDIGIILTSDEEVGSLNGMAPLFNKEGYSSDVVFLPDGAKGWHLEEAAKSSKGVLIKAEGAENHGSRPWEGRNAVRSLSAFCSELYEIFEREFPQTDDDEHWHSTISAVNVFGKESTPTQCIGEASMLYDVRLINLKEEKKFFKLLDKLVKQHEGISYTLQHDYISVSLDKNNEYAKQYVDIAKELLRVDIGWSKSHGASDARFIAQYDIPVLVTYPVGGGHHTECEWIDLKELDRFYEVMKEWVIRVARRKGEKSVIHQRTSISLADLQ